MRNPAGDNDYSYCGITAAVPAGTAGTPAEERERGASNEKAIDISGRIVSYLLYLSLVCTLIFGGNLCALQHGGDQWWHRRRRQRWL